MPESREGSKRTVGDDPVGNALNRKWWPGQAMDEQRLQLV